MSFHRAAMIIAVLFGTSACVSASSDNYALPLNGAVKASVSSDGVTLEAKGPKRVLASMTGKVISVKKAKDGTRTLVMDHGGGMRTVYAQLSHVSAARGEDVRRGRTIGWIGEKGSDASELRFAMKVGEAKIAPLEVIDTKKVKVTIEEIALASAQ
ncbi:M23 family metallopeptidase [Parvularcula sp. ZS-1/3]|uniref:M23 family metallopeptidase n=1 Tax=Parvularcula mediterranea TaxID=2732508 RepID=A0A7Y3RME2_9PROT|nr:M23 family metallopeptidase [Parvularcula mediterranea]NNU16660.1 M23 family metallopeptidase [Parvularcula mediterranea]